MSKFSMIKPSIKPSAKNSKKTSNCGKYKSQYIQQNDHNYHYSSISFFFQELFSQFLFLFQYFDAFQALFSLICVFSKKYIFFFAGLRGSGPVLGAEEEPRTVQGVDERCLLGQLETVLRLLAVSERLVRRVFVIAAIFSLFSSRDYQANVSHVNLTPKSQLQQRFFCILLLYFVFQT